MKVTDLIAKILKKNGIKSVFGLQGGAVVHIFDSIIKNNIDTYFLHHEESAALAAVSNAKCTENIGCAVVTTGPGTTNAITGLLAAWQDSIPVIFISGQARSNHTSYGKKVRQVGTQEVNICDIVKPITKYTKFIYKKDSVNREFNKAIEIAISGRPGPVWLDLALEVQWENLNSYKVKKISKKKEFLSNIAKKNIDLTIKKINKSKKPIFLIGHGVQSSGLSKSVLKKFFLNKNIPLVTTWNSADMFSTKDKYNLGIIGMSGQRGANKAMFNADLIICVGCHLAIPHTTTLYESYAQQAKKIIVNIDSNQLKNLNVNFDIKIKADAKDFFEKIFNKVNKKDNNPLNKYKKLNWYEPNENEKPNSNVFIKKITSKLNDKSAIIVDGGGTALYAGFQSSIIKDNTKLVCSSSISSMGTGLAESIGAFASNKFKELICVIGDGSLLMNCQDLQSISQYKINLKIILVNNNGYLAIRHTQKEFLNKRYFGTIPPDDISFPNFKNLAKAFEIKYCCVKSISEIDSVIKSTKKIKKPLMIELVVDESQETLFKQGYKKNYNGTFSPMTLEEMYPFTSKPISNTNN